MKRIIAALLCCAGLLTAQDFKLIPAPRSLKPGSGELVLRSPVRISVASRDADDRFSAGVLAEDLKSVHGLTSSIGKNRKAAILIGRVGSSEIDREIQRLGLDRSALDQEEGYILNVSPKGALVAAKTAAGVFYGVQTLRQLIGDGGRVPAVTIGDWPALKYRGLSIDISRGPILKEEEMKAVIRTLAEYKLNMLSFYMEHVFRYANDPIVPPPGAAITPELMKRLIDYARQYHVDLVPQQETFGHLHHVLKFEKYAGMAETPYGSVLAAQDEQGYQWVNQVCTQLAKLFPSPFLHIGSDETFELGRGRSKALAEQIGVGNVYIQHMQKVDTMLKPLGKRLMFWGDIALRHPELLSKIPKDLIAMTWTYSPKADFTSYIEPFRKDGMDVFVCPGVNNWSRIFPSISSAVTNINNFVRDGKKLGAMGMFNTEWTDDGEGLFNMTWYPVVFSGAAAWQPGEVDEAAFDHAFDWAFYRASGDTFVKSIHRLDQVNQVLQSAGLRGAEDSLFWMDPYSRYGAETVRKAAPVAPKVRLLAEESLSDLLTNGSTAKHHQDTIPYLCFAARRLDCLGMKFEFGKLIADLYRQALENQGDAVTVRANLNKINSANGLVEDLRDYTNELKQLNRTAWLEEDRPYWLDNVQIRYEAEALYWLHKGKMFTAASQEYSTTNMLPSADELHIFLP